MIRSQLINEYNPKGFVTIFSPIFIDKTTKTFRISALSTFIDTEESWPNIYRGFNRSNDVYNNMCQLGISKITIVNVWFSNVEDLKFKHTNYKVNL